MSNRKACEFANAYQKRIDPKGRSLERIAVDASYSDSIVETAHPHRKSGAQFTLENFNDCRKLGSKIVVKFLKDGDLSENACFKAIEDLRSFYRGQGISTYTYGNAQKWVTMAIKYFIVLKSIDFSDSSVDLRRVMTCFSTYTLFPVDQTICDVLRENPYKISLMDAGIEKVWYNCDNFTAFKDFWKSAGKKIKNPLWDWELDTFNPSKKATGLTAKYHY